MRCYFCAGLFSVLSLFPELARAQALAAPVTQRYRLTSNVYAGAGGYQLYDTEPHTDSNG